jgi:predicted O-methyltransferase YrrM
VKNMLRQHFVPFVENAKALRFTKHPFLQLIGLRGVIADHSEAEEAMLAKYAKGRKSLVEIGVAEGASALALREAAEANGILYLIDPYPAGRIPGLNLRKFCAHRHVNRSNNSSVRWIRDFSQNISKSWREPIDFLFIDGDHSHEGCLRDWNEWSPFVIVGGIVAFHDARLFPNGWTGSDWGPVRVVRKLFYEDQNRHWKILDEVDSLLIVQRTNL